MLTPLYIRYRYIMMYHDISIIVYNSMENLQWVSIDISVIDIDNISIEYLLIA